MKYVVDIDGTICITKNGDYKNSKPIKSRIDKLNKLYWQKDNTITYFTARGTETKKNLRELTEKQFKKWGVMYDHLIFGKPYGDVYIDDKALSDKQFFK